MYVSVLPLAISIRRTNVYEEQSLGLYDNGQDDENITHEDDIKETDHDGESEERDTVSTKSKPKKESPKSKIEDVNKPDFNVFAILFEVVSAYGTVGLSLGYPNTNTSLSAQFTVLSKLVIIAMLIRGRNRGLPYTLDRAIMLPSDKLEQIDRLQDMKAKGKLLAKVGEDPMTTYVKKRSQN
ncbi:AIF_collapsed_G0032140.mRNA.1.CDS.1 [Saccharomyces cerevisiae]|nr:AIF_collapsed_G0032140.mRNA.1.CDS.1 [Saccharomyces cerevisiae]